MCLNIAPLPTATPAVKPLTETPSLWCVAAVGLCLGMFEAELGRKPSVAAPDTVCLRQD